MGDRMTAQTSSGSEAALAAELDELKAARLRDLAASRVCRDQTTLRVRNLLANIRSVFERTVETSDDIEEAALRYIGRFDTLAYSALPLLAGTPTDLETLLHDQLLKSASDGDPRITIAGPPVSLHFRQTPIMALAIHELVTNAIKFGALSLPGAALSVTWHIEQGRVRLRWVESGVPIVSSRPIGDGFGREFLESALPYQLNAETTFALRPGGASCEIVLPLLEPADAA